MALARWEPFGGLASLRRDMDRLFEDFMGRAPSSGGDGTAEPAVEVSDTPEAVVVTAQMPGVSKDHIQVDVTWWRRD